MEALIAPLSQLIGLANRVLPPTSRLNWIYMLSTLMLATGVALATRCYDRRRFLRSLCAFLVPRSIWLHASAVMDYKVAVIGKGIERFLLAPLLLSPLMVGQWVAGWVSGVVREAPLWSSPWAEISYTLAILVAGDFALYASHRLAHRVPFLWEFHKVHHSAEVMTPVTYLREHPVDMVLQVTAVALFVGPVTGVFICVFPGELSAIKVLGLNAGTFIWYLVLGANLRHSHVWLPFGRVLDPVLSSPAQHQIHHSDDPAHYNMNFGSMLSVWDWAFGTLHAPIERPASLRFGLSNGESAKFASLADFYLRPFGNALASLRGTGETTELPARGLRTR